MVTEPLGDKVDLALASDGGGPKGVSCTSTWFAGRMRISLAKPAIGGIIKVYVDLSRVHVFEPGDNGVNITLTQETSHAAA